LTAGLGFFGYGISRASENSGNTALQYLGIGAVGAGMAGVGLGLGWISTGVAAYVLRNDGAKARRWAVAGSVFSGVVALGLGLTRDTLPWTEQGEIWVDQGFAVSIIATLALLGTQIGLNELAWWDHRTGVALAPWVGPEARGVRLVAAF
jgi:uncharacterized membrane protein